MVFSPLSVPPNVFDPLNQLAGRHRIQRVPKNEKSGRRHSSEITVVVLDKKPEPFKLDENDVRIETKRGSGPGGQHRNMTDTCVRAVHKPSGIAVQIDGRSQYQNRLAALSELAVRLQKLERDEAAKTRNSERRSQTDGDRAFTWTDWRDEVTVHSTGRKCSMSRVLSGKLNLLWE